MLRLLLSVVACLSLAGCATHSDQLVEIRHDFYSGDLTGASLAVDRQLEKNRKDADVLKLEKAIVELADGRPRDAEKLLSDVRDRFEHLEQESVGETALSMLSDDNELSYAGEDYEKVLLRTFLAFSNLMHDGGDAEAYALQIADKQQRIMQTAAMPGEQNPKLAYKQVAVGAYLQGVLREESHSGYDDAERSYFQVVSWAPSFRYGAADLDRVKHGRHSAAGNGVVYVFAMVGRGPYKQEAIEAPSSVALTIADFILRADDRYRLPPITPPVHVPQVVLSPNRIDGVLVSADGQPMGRTETITDVGRMAVEQHKAVYDHIVARAVVRRIIKRGVVEATRDAVDAESNPLLSLALDAGQFAWEAAESADTRCWGLLPDKIQVHRVELSAGVHRLSLAPARGLHRIGPAEEVSVEVEDGRNTYVMAFFPDEKIAGKVLVGSR